MNLRERIGNEILAHCFIYMNSPRHAFPMNIGSRLKALRLERGLSLPELSAKAEVAVGLLSQLENADDATANPNLQTLRKISKALGLTVADLLNKVVTTSRAAAPERLDPALTKLLERFRKSGESLDEGVLQALYVLQERDGAPKTTEDWLFLYQTIKMNFDARRRK